MIARDLLTGKSRVGEFLKSPERIPTNILADRLEWLEAFGLAEKSSYQDKPVRFDYRLSAKGADLLPALEAVCAWANKDMPDAWKTPKSFLDLKPDDVVLRDRKSRSEGSRKGACILV